MTDQDALIRSLREALDALDALRLQTVSFTDIQMAYFAVENAARAAVLDRPAPPPEERHDQ